MSAAVAGPEMAARATATAGTPAAARRLQVGGLTPFTSIDYPGQLAAVVFVQGCPWRCGYCHNPHLQARGQDQGPSWSEVLELLRRRAGLLDAVVFSGGEPTVDPALPQAIAELRALGFKVGLHSAGIYAQRLQAVLPLVDWVGLDIKAPLADAARHDRVTQTRHGADAVRRSLAALVQQSRATGLAYECRTTAHPTLLDDAALLQLADELAEAGVAQWALQIFRTQGAASDLPAVASDYPSPATLQRLRQRLPAMTLRRG